MFPAIAQLPTPSTICPSAAADNMDQLCPGGPMLSSAAGKPHLICSQNPERALLHSGFVMIVVP